MSQPHARRHQAQEGILTSNSRFDILPAHTAADIEDAKRLFADYAASLAVDLAYQDFASERVGLPGKYAPPHGALLLARDMNGSAVGCVGIRPLPDGCCEMKRLFILPSARGQGLGQSLAQSAIAAARALGYAEIRLDTLPDMKAAIALYESLGFRPCVPYYAPTPHGTIFMALGL